MSEVVVRRARDDDRDLLFAWRNDPVSVATSGSRTPVDAGTHATWFAAMLADPDVMLLIGEVDGRPIGMVRFDIDRRSSHAVVSINLDPHARGRGLAQPFLLTAVDAARADRPGPIDAVVRRDNTASLRLFAGAGFRRSGTDDEFVNFTLD